jgi:hypothetical protein
MAEEHTYVAGATVVSLAFVALSEQEKQVGGKHFLEIVLHFLESIGLIQFVALD